MPCLAIQRERPEDFNRGSRFNFGACYRPQNDGRVIGDDAEYNPATKKLEVSLTVFINDLELALLRHSERLMSIDKSPTAEFDAQIQAYLAKAFVVTDASGKAAKIEWVGRELDADSVKNDDPAVTLFFEIDLPGGLMDAKLRHAVFCELFKDQTNLILIQNEKRKIELRFSQDGLIKQL